MTACRDVQDLLVDLALDRLPAGRREAVERHLAACTACGREYAALRKTVRWLQHAPALKPSASFRAHLERRLDRLAPETADEPSLTAADRWTFRWHLVVHRVRTSPQVQIQLAAALLVAALGLFMALWRSPDAEPAGTPIAEYSPPSPVADGPGNEAPPGETARKEILDQQVAVRPPAGVEEWTPDFPETSPPALESDPFPRSGRAQLVDRSRMERLRAVDPADSPVPVRPPTGSGASGPEVFPDPVQGVEDAIHRSLRWLARQQREDGSFVPGGGEPGMDVASTAATTLAFLSAGHLGLDPLKKPQDRVVERALTWLQDQAGPDGRIGPAGDPAVEILNQALACLALTEHRLLAGEQALVRFPEEDRILVHALDQLERRFQQLYQAEDPRLKRGAGENAAWASLALVTAHRSGLELNLSPHGQERLAAMMRRLRNEPSQSSQVSSHAVMAMMDRSSGGGALEDTDVQWRRVITPIVTVPQAAPVSLRFLVSSALCPWDGEDARRALWREFQPQLEQSVLPLQNPRYGYFEGRWGAIPEGVVLQTALATLTLQVPQRIQRLQQASREP